MADLRRAPLPDLVAGVVEDARQLIEAEVRALRVDLGDRLGDLGDAIKSWLIAACVALVTTILIGVALAATLTELVGIPLFASLWLVTAIAVVAVAALVYRARGQGRRATARKPEDAPRALPGDIA